MTLPGQVAGTTHSRNQPQLFGETLQVLDALVVKGQRSK